MEENVFQLVKTFASIIWEAFPFVVLGAIIAGILEEVVPQQAISKLIPKNPFLAVSLWPPKKARALCSSKYKRLSIKVTSVTHAVFAWAWIRNVYPCCSLYSIATAVLRHLIKMSL